MTNEQIEAVARAICIADGQDWDVLPGSYNGRQRQRDFVRYATAAIAAMPDRKAAMIEGARLALEAAAGVAESYVVGKPMHLRDDHTKPKAQSLARLGTANAIRALDPAQIAGGADD